MSRLCREDPAAQTPSILVNVVFLPMVYYGLHLHRNRKSRPGFTLIRALAVYSYLLRLLVVVLYKLDAAGDGWQRLLTFSATASVVVMLFQWEKHMIETLYITVAAVFSRAAPTWVKYYILSSQAVVTVFYLVLVYGFDAQFDPQLDTASDVLSIFSFTVVLQVSIVLCIMHLRVYHAAKDLQSRSTGVQQWMRKTQRTMVLLVLIGVSFALMLAFAYGTPLDPDATTSCPIARSLIFDVVNNTITLNFLWHTDVPRAVAKNSPTATATDSRSKSGSKAAATDSESTSSGRSRHDTQSRSAASRRSSGFAHPPTSTTSRSFTNPPTKIISLTASKSDFPPGSVSIRVRPLAPIVTDSMFVDAIPENNKETRTRQQSITPVSGDARSNCPPKHVRRSPLSGVEVNEPIVRDITLKPPKFVDPEKARQSGGATPKSIFDVKEHSVDSRLSASPELMLQYPTRSHTQVTPIASRRGSNASALSSRRGSAHAYAVPHAGRRGSTAYATLSSASSSRRGSAHAAGATPLHGRRRAAHAMLSSASLSRRGSSSQTPRELVDGRRMSVASVASSSNVSTPIALRK